VMPDAPAPTLDLAAIEAVAAFGPPGVWYTEGHRIWSQQDGERTYVGWAQSVDWAAFAVATHNGLPALLARVRALEAEVAQQRKWMEVASAYFSDD
jgi:hypothetical protein